MLFDSKNVKKFLVASASAAMIATAVVPAVGASTSTTAAFTDVPSRYVTPVDYLVSNNLARGLSATQFGINENIKRGDAAIILAQALGVMDSKAPDAGFTDVPKRGALAINSLKAAGIINGKTKTNFGFNDKITRGEIALIISNANAYNFKGDVDSLEFTDVNDRYSEAVAGLVANGITQGTSATQFGTDKYIKRGDFAIFTFRAEMLEVDEALADFKESMNDFASFGASLGFKVVVDESAVNTFNIIGDEEVPVEGGTGIFEELAYLGIDTIDVNGETFYISDEDGNVTEEAQEAKEEILASLFIDETVDITFYVPFEGEYVEATYTFNFQAK